MTHKLTQCSDCGENISKQAESCPKCGKPAEKFPMGLAVILAFLGAVFIGPIDWDYTRELLTDTNYDQLWETCVIPHAKAFFQGDLELYLQSIKIINPQCSL